MYLYNTWEETGDESVECRDLRKFLRQIELHKTGHIYILKSLEVTRRVRFDWSTLNKHNYQVFCPLTKNKNLTVYLKAGKSHRVFICLCLENINSFEILPICWREKISPVSVQLNFSLWNV